MISKIKKPVSILLSLIMVFSVFTIVPLSASAAVGDFVPESEYLTFTAEEAGSSVTLNVPTGNSFQYDLNGTGLTDYTLGTEITLANVGDSVRFRGRNTAFNASHHVSIVGKVACSGNVMSLRLDEDGRDQGLSYGCYNYMFMDCTGLTAAPELPETTLANRCYESMFFGCTNLTVAPELPATALATGCYSSMFAGCERLTTAPELWATTLATGCYERMFYACRSLTTAPELPATTLAPRCYSYMFAGCERLTTAPELPATELVSNCYSRMFYRCSNIKLSETQTAEYSIPYSVPSGGDGTTATDALNNMFYGTGGTFAGTPEINKTYYLYREVPKYTVTWKNEDDVLETDTDVAEGTTPTYDGETPTKDADENYTYTFAGWTPEVVAATADATYTATFTATKKPISSTDLYEGLVLDKDNTIKFIIVKSGENWRRIDLSVYLDGTLVKELYTQDVSTTEPDRYYTTTQKCIVDSYEFSYGDPVRHVLYLKSVYDVTWKNDDGTELEKDENVVVGTTPTYDGSTPEKAEDANYTYTFADWSDGTNTYAANAIPAVTADVTYTAQYTATFKGITSGDLYEGLVIDAGTPIKFMIIKSGQGWRRVDLSVYLDGTLVKELVTQSVSQTEPDRYYTTTKKCIVDSYEFSNGDPTRHVLYLKSVYDVTWKNDDGTELEKDENVVVGTTPTYNGATPYKADGADCIYTFSGWTPEVSAVTGDATYTATFTESEKPETIKDCNNKYGNFRLYSNVPIVSFSNVNDLLTGAIIPFTYGDSNTMIPVLDAKGYSYKFYDQTGTEIPAQIADSSSEPGSDYELSDDVTVYTNVINFTRPAGCTAIYIVATVPAPAPAPAKLTLHVGENGKVVMNNGTFGNATDASNIYEIHAPVNVADGYNASIANVSIGDGHTCNIVEGGSINIATGGELSFYPSADNTGVITAIPAEGYVFVGWYNGDTLYSSDAALSYQSISEDITLTAKFEGELFWKHSVTLGGDIGVNFYLNPAVLDTYTGAKTVTFSWDGNETTVDVPATATADGYKVTCNVVAAQMAHKIHAVVKADGTALAQTDDYSVQDYAETVYANPAEYDSAKPNELKSLVLSLLNYGAMAQTVFDSSLKEHPDLANKTVGDNGYEYVTADMIAAAIKDEASDLNEVATQLGAKYYTNSLIYLSKNTLRIYFTPTSYPGEIPNAGAYDGNLSGYYYYVEHANIPAAELDNQQTFNVNGTEFTFSALDYAKAVVESTKMEPEQKNLAKALYLYNMTANDYFDAAPAPVENEVISSGSIEDFSTLNVGDYIAKGVEYAADNDYKVVLTGGTYGTESRDGIVVRNGDYNFNAGEYGMGTYSYHVPQPNVFIEDYNENEKFYPAVDGVEGNAFVVVAKDDTQKIITIAGANVIQN